MSADKTPSEPAQSPRTPMSPRNKWALIAICLVLLLSVGARAAFSGGGSDAPADGGKASVAPSSVGGQSLLPDGTPGSTTPGSTGETAPAEPKGGVEGTLPYITEGSFFALIGFALGYASRKFVKIGLIFIAIFFVGLQVLSYMDVVNIDWGRGIELVKKFVLNIQEGESIKKVLTDKLPTAGGLTAGYMLGFRKG